MLSSKARRVRKSPASEAVWAARIGAIAALAGAVIGAAGAGIPAFMSIRAEDERAQTQFLREQRQAVYVEFLDAQHKFTVALDDQAKDRIFDQGPQIDTASLQEARQEIDTVASKVRIVGTARATEIATGVQSTAKFLYLGSILVRNYLTSKGKRSLEYTSAERSWHDDRDRLSHYFQDFQTEARQDLGVTDGP